MKRKQTKFMFKKIIIGLFIMYIAACSSTNNENKLFIDKGKKFRFSGSNVTLSTEYDHKKIKKELKQLQEMLKGKEVEFDTLKRAAVGEMLVGNYAMSMRHLRFLIKKDPQNHNLKILLAENAIRSGKLPFAEFLLKKIKKNNESEVLNLMGLISYLKNEPAEAEISFQRAKAADPKNLSAILNLGLLYLEFYKYDEAYEELKQVINLDKQHPDAQLGMATILRLRKDLDKTETILEELVDSHKSNPVLYHNLAVFLQKNEDYSDAYEAIKKSLRYAKKLKFPTRDSKRLSDEIKKQLASD